MSQWVQAAPGIRYRKHASRKQGARLDRYFVIRHSVNGKQIDESLGWASSGWTVTRAQAELSRLQEAKRTGKGPVTLREEAQASRRAEELRTEQEAAAERRQKVVAELWDRYSKEVVAVENRPRTAAQKTRIWEKRIKHAIGGQKVNDVTEEEVGKLVRAPLRLDEGGQVAAGKAEAGNVYRLLHHMFGKALRWGLRAKEAGNPLENITEPKVARRERLLTGSEIGALLRALDAAEADGSEHPRIIAAIRVVILTGPRISEPLGLRWQEIRRDEMELHLADTKTGFSRRPISAATLAVLDSIERMPGVDFVFRGIRDQTKPLSYSAVERAFRRMAKTACVKDCTLHTIRHWFATMTANSVSNPRVGMALTGHKSHAAYMNYLHSDQEQARALANQLAEFVSGLAATKSDVVPMRKE